MKKYSNILSELDDDLIELISDELPEFEGVNLENIKNKFNNKVVKSKAVKKGLKKSSWLALAASICIFFTGIVNLNPVVAASLLDVPIIGTITEWISLDKIELYDKYREINIVIPEIVGLENLDAQEEINNILKERGMAVYDKAVEVSDKIESDFNEKGFITSIPEYVTQMFLMLKSDSSILSFKVVTIEIKASAYETVEIYNIDLDSSKLLKLSDLFVNGYDYKSVLNMEIINMMEEANKNDEGSYFIESFESVNENTKFYFNDNNKLVIVFNEYEIAAGYMGMPEFVIDTDIFKENIIDVDYFY